MSDGQHRIKFNPNGMRCPVCCKRIRIIENPKGMTGFAGYEIEAERVPGSTRHVYRPVAEVACITPPARS